MSTTQGPLFGRDTELAVVLGLLDDPAVRTVVLGGPTGVGKTKLALAARDASAFPLSLVVQLWWEWPRWRAPSTSTTLLRRAMHRGPQPADDP